MGPKNNHNKNYATLQNYNELKALVNSLKSKVEELSTKNSNLEKKVEVLEEKQSISSHVTSLLTQEIDRLGQYQNRYNVIVKGVALPEKEHNDEVEHKICSMIKEEMGIPDVLQDFDKAHRVGKIKEVNGKKQQDIIVRFKSHAARYKVFNNRKTLKNFKKIRPKLTHRRGKLLYDASLLIENVDNVDFVLANMHGDLQLRLKESYDGKHFFNFDSIDSLTYLLKDLGCIE